MPKPVLTSAERMLRQSADDKTAGSPQYRQPVSPHWSDEEEEWTADQATSHGHERTANENTEPLSSQLPYSEQDHRLDGGHPSQNSSINFRPGVEGPPDYVEDASGRRERYIINEFGKRVAWPYMDHEQSSDDGTGNSDMVHLESGRILPRAEWEAGRSWEPSSDEDQNPSQSQPHPIPRTKRTTPSKDQDSDHQIPVVQNRQSAGFRGSRRQRVAGHKGRSRHGNGGSLHLDQ